jgi:hypothetical protein
MHVAAPTPQAAGILLPIGPDMAKLLAVVALCKEVFGFVRIYLDGDVAEAGQFEYFLGFACPG